MADEIAATEATLPAPTLPTFQEEDLLRLARAIVMEIHPLDKILAEHNLTADQLSLLQKNAYFARVLEDFRLDWGGPLSTPKRIAMKSLAALEDGLPKLAARMTDKSESLDAQVKVAKQLGEWGGLGADKSLQGSGEKFSITINLGADEKLRFEKNVAPTPPKSEGAAALPLNGEGKSSGGAIQLVIESEDHKAAVREISKTD